MSDARLIRKKVLLRLLGHPTVIAPLMAGMTALSAGWAMGWRGGLAAFAGLAGLLLAAGAFVTRLLVSGATIAREATEEIVQAEGVAAQRALDDLDRQLVEADTDPRPETALRDLRALRKAFEEAENAASPVHLPLLVDLRARVNELFGQCVQAITQTGRLWATAKQLNSAVARQPLIDQREKIIADVQATVKQLSDTLVGVQSLGSGEGSSRELTRLREELDQSLAVARTVEERVDSLLHDDVRLRHSQIVSTTETKG